MRKSPAFRFYADDFLGGVATFNFEQRGLYITLLAIQWNQGYVSQDDFESLSNGTAIAQPLAKRVLAKFDKDSDGHFRNARLEEERGKQDEYRANRSESGKAGANKRWHSHSAANGKGMAQPIANDGLPFPFPLPVVEREKEGLPEIPPMVKKEFTALAEMRGVPQDCAEWFWNTNDARNWLDSHGQPIRKVEPLLMNALKSWRTNAQAKPAQNNQPQSFKPALGGAEMILRSTELKRIEDKIREIKQGYESHQDVSAHDKAQIKTLRTRANELKTMLGMMV